MSDITPYSPSEYPSDPRFSSTESPLAKAEWGGPVYHFEDWPIRVEMRDGEPWFVVVDICRALDLTNVTMATEGFPADDLSTTEVINAAGARRQSPVTNQGGMFELVFRSRKPEARAFRRWVTHEVLPELLRTGGYQMPQTFAEALRALADSEEAKARQALELEAKDHQIAELTPAADAWCAMVDTTALHNIEEVAKLVSADPRIKPIGRNRLFKRMKRWGWLIDSQHPYQAQIDNGRLVMKTKTYLDADGEPQASHRVWATFKGLTEIHRRLLLAESQRELMSGVVR